MSLPAEVREASRPNAAYLIRAHHDVGDEAAVAAILELHNEVALHGVLAELLRFTSTLLDTTAAAFDPDHPDRAAKVIREQVWDAIERESL